MFRRLSEPLPLSEASLLLLRPAMNAPVLNVGFLPVGPARAAVVAFAEEYGGIGVALGIRSNESGQLCVIRNQESIDFDVPLVEAVEPLLAEAERMGFLFDEDMLEAMSGGRGRSEAMVHWAVLMGGMERLLPTRAPRPEPRAGAEDGEPVGPLSPSLAVEESQYPELILDDVAPLVLAGGEEPAPGDDETFEDDPTPASARPPEPARDPSPPLAGDLDDDLDGTLEDVLDEALADGFDADFGAALDEDMPDWASSDPLLSELDLTEPTAPIAAARAPAPAPVRASVVAVAAPAAPVAPVAPVAPAAPPPVVLSKFRNAGPSPRRSEVGADRSSELARIPIVRVRREVEKKVPFLARLLSSF